jgi:O-acetylhomoserine/O-acetylserine sulfhydrylase-like pyridoxal-dependent enzyme
LNRSIFLFQEGEVADQQKSIGFHTRAAKTYLDGKRVRCPLTVPITQGNIFQIESSEMLGKLFKEGADEVYTRFGNPTLTAVCEKCALLESAESALVFSSGMGAISSRLALPHFLPERIECGNFFRIKNIL